LRRKEEEMTGIGVGEAGGEEKERG